MKDVSQNHASCLRSRCRRERSGSDSSIIEIRMYVLYVRVVLKKLSAFFSVSVSSHYLHTNIVEENVYKLLFLWRTLKKKGP